MRLRAARRRQCRGLHKSINPERMKIKLIIVDYFTGDGKSPAADYFISDGHIDKWIYSPEMSIKRVETDFMS